MAAGVLGCGKSPGTGDGAPALNVPAQVPAPAKAEPAAAASEGPAAAAAQFLEAVRTGNDEKVTKMLGTVARAKLAEANISVIPPASDTAKFKVGKVEYIGEDGARVNCLWTDLDENGEPRSDHALWVLRREAEGWRVVGVAADTFDKEPPLLLNFEDPQDVVKKQQWLRAEVARRSQEEKSPGNTGENSPGQTSH
jgi:hypothetical protein